MINIENDYLRQISRQNQEIYFDSFSNIKQFGIK